ncbi:MAG: exodeoxyribonuclease VII large subunit [Wenzhouxiangellaceae bacterium]|nr:exodeoxyribonuclease VII large subunit [Wenzhouxiangellaceae bacterium]
MSVTAPGPETRVYQPSELNREAKLHLEAGFARLWLVGEVSNLARPASGHLYFTLKDARAQIRCALFKGNRGSVAQLPGNGDQVLVRGRLSLYEPRGDYQLIADAMLPAGAGALQQAFEALKRKLEAEGLFAAEHKRALPTHPRVIAVVTSASGAAVRDILTTLQRRWPAARVELHASPVQGDAAVPGLLRALDTIARHATAEVVIVARGGGSIEDLWAFNDEHLARRIRAMPMPVVSGVGHETDFTIADFVADLRAATPTAAAEAVTPDGPALLRAILRLEQRAARALTRTLEQAGQRVDSVAARLVRRHPRRQLGEQRRELATLHQRLARAPRGGLRHRRDVLTALAGRLARQHPRGRLLSHSERLAALRERLLRAQRGQHERCRRQLAVAARALETVSPLAVLNRGYALVQDDQGRVLARREQFEAGQRITLRLADFRVDAEVRETRSPAD